MDTYKDGDIEDEREAALFDDDDDTGAYLTPDPADVYPDWGPPLEAIGEEFNWDFYDDEPNPYSGTYSEE